jgi:MFS family permease
VAAAGDARAGRRDGLGFAGYCLTLASLPAYAVARGASADTAGVVTAVFLLVTVAGQSVVPALTARVGLGPVLAGGLFLLGAPSPLYVLDDGVVWLSAVSAVRGAGFAVLTVLGAVLAAQVAPPTAAASRSACTGWPSRCPT